MPSKDPPNEPIFAYAQLNARVMPLQRGELYEDPLLDALEKNGYASVTGGGTLQQKSGEIEYCGIDLDLLDLDHSVPFICQFLESRGAPKGSKLTYTRDGKNVAVPFGTLEGLAIYLNGTDLPAEVYKQCDVNFVIAECNRLLADAGSMQGYWQGPRETALYFYGPSVATMRERLSPFLATFPLCQNARLTQIA
jgi:hypothetical protein